MIEAKKPQYGRLNISALNYSLRQRLLATQQEEVFDLQVVCKTQTRLGLHLSCLCDILFKQVTRGIVYEEENPNT